MLKGGRGMRFNWRELMAIAAEPAKRFSKEGPLYMKVTPSGWRKKADTYSERWCRLRGNLLFYFKGRDMLSEPQGVVVLEQCFIKEEYGEIQSFAFCIEYIGEEHNQYFAAHSSELRDEWVVLLQSASYETLRTQLQSLRMQLMARTGQDPIDEERHGIMGQTDPSDAVAAPILEMSISCTDLPKNSFGETPSTFVSVSCVTPPDTRWSKNGQTEIIGRSCNPFFLTTVSFETTRNISVITRLRANVYEVQDRNMHTVSPIGQVICSFRDIVTSPDNKLVRDIIGADGMPVGGKITVLLWELDDVEKPQATVMKKDRTAAQNHSYTPHTPVQGYHPPPSPTARTANGGGLTRTRSYSLARSVYLKNLCCNPCTKSYRFPNADGTFMVQVQEAMMESKLNFLIPQQIIKIFLQEEKRKLEQLTMFEELSHEWEKVRSAVMSEHVTMIARYNESLEYLSKQTKGPQFKKSTAKADKLLEFVPINLHLQRLRVEEPGSRECLYDMITVGAPAAHTMKFRHGGLKKMLQHYTEEQQRQSTRNLTIQAAKTLTQISELKNSIDWLATDVLSAARHVGVESMRKKAAALNDKVADLLAVINENFMEEAFNTYRNASFRASPTAKTPLGSSDKSTTKSSSPSDSGNSSSRTSGTSDNDSNRFSSASSVGSANPQQVGRSPYEDWEWNGVSFVKSSSSNIVSVGGGPTNHGQCSGGKLLTSWRCLKIKNLLEYMNIIQQVVELLPVTASQKERLGAVESSVKHLKETVGQIQERAKYSIAFLRMQEEHSNLSFLQSLQCRRDIVFSQALTALVAGVMIKFRENISSKVFMSQMSSLGILAHFEGLLSTYGDEMGMLEDFAVGIHDLVSVTFKIAVTSTDDDNNMIPALTGTRSSVVVVIPVLPSMVDAIPVELLNGQPIKVYPVLFNVGINEEQTMAEIFGDTSLQDHINQDNLQKLDNYYSRLVHMIPHKDWRQSSSTMSLDVLMNSLRHHVNSKKNKNIEILHISSQLARRLDGIRFTSCKSAKDRTAMSVTLEECLILQDEHQLHAQMFTHLLDSMRSEGTRRDNTRKNVGVPKYAFNKMQLRAFPKLYRPPEGTFGKTVIT